MKTIKEAQKENRQAFSDRIKAAKTKEELEKLEKRITKHYNIGTISATHFDQLDGMIMRRLAMLD